MKILRALALLAFGAASLAGCGDGGVQSPDFTPELLGLSLDSSDADATRTSAVDEPPAFTVPAGRRVTLDVTGSFTAPPGSDDETESRNISAEFTIEPSDGGTVEEGEFRGTRPGTVTVTAERDGNESNPIVFTVTAAVIDSIDVEPASASIPVGASQDFNAVGVYSDDARRPVLVNWSVAPATGVVTLANATNTSTVTATSAPGATIGATAVLTANRPASGTTPALTDTADITIDDRTVLGLVEGSAQCTPSSVGIGFTSQCTVQVLYSDNTTQDAGTLVTWSSPQDPSLVSVDAASGQVTGVAQGTATITATLTNGGTPSTASTSLAVLSSASARCQQPLVAPAAVASGANSGLCLLCTVTNPANAADDDAETFASIDTTLGLLFGTSTLRINAQPPETLITPTGPVGFVIAQPPGLLLSAEVLSTLTVSTIDNTGNVLQSGGARPQPSDPIPILPATVTLLGTIGGQDAALISFEPTGQFNGIALTFNAGVASVLPSINVFQGCALANPEATP